MLEIVSISFGATVSFIEECLVGPSIQKGNKCSGDDHPSVHCAWVAVQPVHMGGIKPLQH